MKIDLVNRINWYLYDHNAVDYESWKTAKDLADALDIREEDVTAVLEDLRYEDRRSDVVNNKWEFIEKGRRFLIPFASE